MPWKIGAIAKLIISAVVCAALNPNCKYNTLLNIAGSIGIKTLAAPATVNADPSKLVSGKNVPLGVLQTLKVIFAVTKVDGKNIPVGAVPPQLIIEDVVAPAPTVT